MKTIVLATGNADKAAEIKTMLGGSYDVVTMKSLGLDPDIVEDGDTYEANALIKSMNFELIDKIYIETTDPSAYGLVSDQLYIGENSEMLAVGDQVMQQGVKVSLAIYIPAKTTETPVPAAATAEPSTEAAP